MNVIVQARFSINIPESVVEKLMGRADDGTEVYYEAALEKVENAVKEDFEHYAEYIMDEPAVEAV
jgi:hypothetical protein